MPEQPTLLTGWGRTAPTAAWVREVSPDQLAELIVGAGPRGVLARGLGRSYGDAAQNAGGTIVRLPADRSDLTLDDQTGTVTVGAGLSLDDLMRAVVPRGYFVPVSPGTRYVTVGGAIAADIHGKNQHVHGSFGSQVEWLEIVDGTGAVRRLDPVSTPDLYWATIGGMGLTGVVTRASIRLLPIESSAMRVDTDRSDNLAAAIETMSTRDEHATYSVAWIDLMASGAAIGRSVLTRGDHATVAELPTRLRRDPLAFDPQPRLVAPAIPTRAAVNRATMRAFNEAWFRTSPRRRRGQITGMAGFFHPLDGVRDWNRLYGARGFVQYQFVVPLGAENVLDQVVRRISESREGSSLAVLKQFGRANPAPLSFPLPGWTLALDLRTTPSLGSLLDHLDQLVLAAGGRVYLAKDSRTRPEVLAAMYPRLAEFAKARDVLDPERRFTSDLARRLHL